MRWWCGFEKSAQDRELAGRQAASLIGTVLSLKQTLPSGVRRNLADAIFQDAAKGELPHQWERVEDAKCDGHGHCVQTYRDWNCYRDTVTGQCHDAYQRPRGPKRS